MRPRLTTLLAVAAVAAGIASIAQVTGAVDGLEQNSLRLGFEARQDVPMGPEMRWLTVQAPGDPHDLLLAAVDHHIPPADRQAMREIVTKGDLAVFIQVDDLDKTFESLRAAGVEVLQEPVNQPYGVRDAAVRDPSGNHLRLSQPLA